MSTIDRTHALQCRHSRRAGTYESAAALGAFVEEQERSPQILVPDSASSIAGTHIAVKDNIDVAGWPTRAGSQATSDEPAAKDALVVDRLRRAGALITAKTRMDEFAMTTSGQGMRNPVDPRRSAGGSSGGSALAVAVGGFCLAIGTDSGGSTRIPASYCGVVGFKPTFGRVSVEGVVPLAASLDHIGLLGCSVGAVREAFAVVVDQDGSPHEPVPTFEGMRVGIPRPAYLEGAVEPVRRAFEGSLVRLRAIGCTIIEVDLPAPQLVLAAHYCIGSVESLRYHADRFGSFSRHGDGARVILENAGAYSERDYADALIAREAFAASAWRLFDDIDLLALPTTPTFAPPEGSPMIELGDRTVDALTGTLWYTALFNDTGQPAISIPISAVNGLPIGLQLVARWGDDDLLLDVAEQI